LVFFPAFVLTLMLSPFPEVDRFQPLGHRVRGNGSNLLSSLGVDYRRQSTGVCLSQHQDAFFAVALLVLHDDWIVPQHLLRLRRLHLVKSDVLRVFRVPIEFHIVITVYAHNRLAVKASLNEIKGICRYPFASRISCRTLSRDQSAFLTAESVFRTVSISPDKRL